MQTAKGGSRVYVVTVVGVVVILVAVIGLAGFHPLARYVIRRATSITSPDSTLYAAWIDPGSQGIPMYRRYTWFNVSNAREVVQGSEVPNLVMVGPYTYLEQRRKDPDSVQWFPNGTVGYRYTAHFDFVPNMSVDALTGRQLDPNRDVLHTINMPLYGIAYRLAQLPTVVRQFGNFSFTKALCCYVLDWAISSGYFGDPALGRTGIFVQRSVHELLWGYRDPIWEMVHPVLEMLLYDASVVFLAQFNGSQPVPSPYTFRSGQRCPLWMPQSDCNGSAVGLTLEGTGATLDANTATSSGNITTWAGQNQLWWVGPPEEGIDAGLGHIRSVNDSHAAPEDCGFLQGGDGLRFTPNLQPEAPLTIFLDAAWRSFQFTFRAPAEVKGIPVNQYVIAESELDNTTARNQNCFQMRRYGIFNASAAVFGPAMLSKAFYLDARLEESLLNFTLSNTSSGPRYSLAEYFRQSPRYGALGMTSPLFREDWDAYLSVHPSTGLTLLGAARGLASTPIGPLAPPGCNAVGTNNSMFDSTANVTSTLLPLALLEKQAIVSDEWASKLRLYTRIEAAVPPVLITLLCFGMVLAAAAPAWRMRQGLRLANKVPRGQADVCSPQRTSSSDGTTHLQTRSSSPCLDSSAPLLDAPTRPKLVG